MQVKFSCFVLTILVLSLRGNVLQAAKRKQNIMSNNDKNTIFHRSKRRQLTEDEIYNEQLVEKLGLYFMPFKFFGQDIRRNDGKNFRHRFPDPQLRKQYQPVVEICKNGWVVRCMERIYTLARTDNGGGKFSSAFEEFRFNVTALYYLCSYTTHYYRAMISGTNDLCFEGNKDLLDRRKGRNSWRWYCAKNYFCPDIVGFDNDKCKWSLADNKNFVDLIANRMNMTCPCGKGQRWSNPYHMCTDIDECKENKHTCDRNFRCQNTPSSFKCLCRVGYDSKIDSKGNMACVNRGILKNSYMLPQRKLKRKQLQKKSYFQRQLEMLLGISGAIRLETNLAMVTFILAIAQLLR